MQQIPILSATNKITSYVSAERASQFPVCMQIKNKRGHIKAVRQMEDSIWTQDLIARGKPSRWGQSFEQELSTGHAWALKGVAGSRAS